MAGYFLGGDPRNLSGIPPRDLVHAASKIPAAGTGSDLYQAFLRRPAGGESAIVTLIPYYTFHNRDITSMQVWVPYRQ